MARRRSRLAPPPRHRRSRVDGASTARPPRRRRVDDGRRALPGRRASRAPPSPSPSALRRSATLLTEKALPSSRRRARTSPTAKTPPSASRRRLAAGDRSRSRRAGRGPAPPRPTEAWAAAGEAASSFSAAGCASSSSVGWGPGAGRRPGTRTGRVLGPFSLSLRNFFAWHHLLTSTFPRGGCAPPDPSRPDVRPGPRLYCLARIIPKAGGSAGPERAGSCCSRPSTGAAGSRPPA